MVKRALTVTAVGIVVVGGLSRSTATGYVLPSSSLLSSSTIPSSSDMMIPRNVPINLRKCLRCATQRWNMPIMRYPCYHRQMHNSRFDVAAVSSRHVVRCASSSFSPDGVNDCRLNKALVRKMRLEDLEKELATRNLNATGVRTTLIARLLRALENEEETARTKEHDQDDVSTSRSPDDTQTEMHSSPRRTHVPRRYLLKVNGYTDPDLAGAGIGLVLKQLGAEASHQQSNNHAKSESSPLFVWSGQLYMKEDRSLFEAEYTAILLGIEYVRQVYGDDSSIFIQTSNDVVMQQIQGTFLATNKILQRLFEQFNHKRMEMPNNSFDIEMIQRQDNKDALSLAKQALLSKETENVSPTWTVVDPLIAAANMNGGSDESIPATCAKEEKKYSSKTTTLVPTPATSDDDLRVDQSSSLGSTIASTTQRQQQKPYVLQFDGGSRGNPGPSGAGFVLYDDAGTEVWHGAQFLDGNQTNNVAEYSALVTGLKCARDLGIKQLLVEGDSQLVVKQVNGEYRVKERTLKAYHRNVLDVTKDFEYIEIQHIPRAGNVRADELANLAMDEKASHGLVVDEKLEK